MQDRVRITIADHVADVKLVRSDKMNALDPAMFQGIADAIEQLAGMAEVRCVVLSGEGAGILRRARHGEHGVWRHRHVAGRPHARRRQPAAACRLGLAHAADARHRGGPRRRVRRRFPDHVGGRHPHRQSPHTRFAIREVYWGLVPDMAGIALWRGIARDDVLRELTYTAREFEGAEALALGFVTKLADDPWAEAHALAQADRPRATRKRCADRSGCSTSSPTSTVPRSCRPKATSSWVSSASPTRSNR